MHIIIILLLLPTTMVRFDEYLTMMVQQLEYTDERDELRHVFKLFDHDKTGRVGVQNLQRIAKEFGDDFAEGEILMMIRESRKTTCMGFYSLGFYYILFG